MLQLILIALLSSAPAEAGKKNKTPPPPQMPSWFLTPPAGCGGGSAIFDPMMREIGKVEADTNARADLTRQVKSSVTSMVQTHYAKSTGPGGATQSTASADSVATTATDMALLGARTVASEVSDGQLYLMVCIKPESLVSSFQEMAYLDDAIKTALATEIQTAYGSQAADLKALGFAN